MRRLSQILATLALLMPVLVYAYLFGSAYAYQRQHGFGPEGKANIGVIAFGFRAMVILALMASVAAVVALLTKKTTSMLQRLEVAAFCLLIPAAAILAKSVFGTWQATQRALIGL